MSVKKPESARCWDELEKVVKPSLEHPNQPNKVSVAKIMGIILACLCDLDERLTTIEDMVVKE